MDMISMYENSDMLEWFKTHKPTYFDHIRFNMGFLQDLINILGCICIRCGKLLPVNENDEEIVKLLKNKQGEQCFHEITTLCKKFLYCHRCGMPVHKIYIDKKYDNMLVAECNGRELFLSPELCYEILRFIPNEDYIIMGFDPIKLRPEDMILIKISDYH